MTLHALDLPLFASLAFIAGPVLFARSFRDFRTQRLIQNTPTSRIRSMPMGLVEVQGGVVPRSTVMAPFSNRPCAYWEVDISTETRRGQWHVVHRNHSGHPFFLHVGTAMPRSRALSVGEGDELQATGTEDPHAHRLRELSEQSSAVLRKGEIQDTFIISQQSQRDLTTSLSLRAIAELTGGPLLTLFGLGYWVYTLSARFGAR